MLCVVVLLCCCVLCCVVVGVVVVPDTFEDVCMCTTCKPGDADLHEATGKLPNPSPDVNRIAPTITL